MWQNRASRFLIAHFMGGYSSCPCTYHIPMTKLCSHWSCRVHASADHKQPQYSHQWPCCYNVTYRVLLLPGSFMGPPPRPCAGHPERYRPLPPWSPNKSASSWGSGGQSTTPSSSTTSVQSTIPNSSLTSVQSTIPSSSLTSVQSTTPSSSPAPETKKMA